jgi:arginyl-tRNA synthetase
MNKDKGLGDTLARFFKATGIKAVVENITDDCGCKSRQDKLNKLVEY